MDFESAKSVAKSQIEIYLQQKGINTRKPFKCLNPAHTDNNPSMSFDRERNRVKCFSCGESYDIFDLIGIDYNISAPGEQMKRAFELFSLQVDKTPRNQGAPLDWDGTPLTAPPPIPTAEATPAQKIAAQEYKERQQATNALTYAAQCAERVGETDYFSRRGIPPELVKRFELGYDPAFNKGTGGAAWQAVIIPTSGGSYVARNTDPNAKQKDRYRKVGAAQLLNVDALYRADQPIIITEGELDALSIMAAGGRALALGSTDNYKKLIEQVKQIKGQRRDIPPLVLALDNDDAGRATTPLLMNGLHELGATVYAINLYGENKDANEALLKDRAALTAALSEISTPEQLADRERQRERDEYLNTSAAAHVKEFVDGIAAAANTPSISTGFRALDTVLDGGLYEGLYIIGAISSLGKTTLALQIIDQIAKSGRDCLVFSLEMARSELMSKSISRLTLTGITSAGGDTRNAKTARGITAGDRYPTYNRTEMELICNAVRNYSDYARHIFIHEGVGDIGAEQVREIVAKHKRITGNSPVVLVDYLQILAPADVRATDKQNTDKAVLELKRISRDYKIPVIGISSFNRENYSSPVSMISFKESGAIEYSSDVLIGLQLEGVGVKNFDVDAAKAETPRKIELKILKNRNGATGGAVLYHYYPQFNYYQEQGIIRRDAADKSTPAQSGGKITVKTGAAKKTKKEMLEQRAAKEPEAVELVKVGGSPETTENGGAND